LAKSLERHGDERDRTPSVLAFGTLAYLIVAMYTNFAEKKHN
jgi:hypothetical protein